MPGYPLHPRHPERVCWGCDEYCPAHDLTCGKDTLRTPHPLELFGDDWDRWAADEVETVDDATRARVVEALRCVLEPEMGINIVDLGVLHEVRVDGSCVRVSLTSTSASLSVTEQLRRETAQRVRALKGVTEVQVVRLLGLAVEPHSKSPEARVALRAAG